MHPILFELGPSHIQISPSWFYGALYGLGMIGVLWFLYWSIAQRKIISLPKNTLATFLICMGGGATIGLGGYALINWFRHTHQALSFGFGAIHVRLYQSFVLLDLNAPLQIRYYGLMYAVGITCGLFLVRREVLRKQIPLSADDVVNFVMLIVLGGIVGARLYYVIFNWDSYKIAPGEILKIWHGGLAIHGGVIGGTLIGWGFVRRHQVSFLKMADVTAPALILAQTFGRFGNFMNGDAHGFPTNMPWGIVFPPGSIAGREFPDKALHPTMLYEMIINFGIFVFLWKIRTRSWKDGFLFCLYCILYSTGRFIVSGFRADSLMLPLGGLGSFRVARVISLVIIAVAGAVIVQRRLWETTEHAGA